MSSTARPDELLAPIAPIDEADLARLHRRLEDDTQRGNVLDIAYRIVDTPIGALLLAATEAGLLRVAFESEGHDKVLEILSAGVSPRILKAPKRLETVARELDEYFAGRRTDFDLPLDFALTTGFRRLVQQHLTDIEYGKTQSYAGMARLVGNPNAVRAVGTACALNPLPVVLPCHRVIRSDGSLGQYAGGPELKKTLLGLESSVA